MDRLAYVWMAFSITWIAIFVYMLMLGRRQQKLAHELEHLQQVLKTKK